MHPIIDFEQLEDEARGAARLAYDLLAEANPDEQVACFALCTDDAVMTVFPAGCTREWLNEGQNTGYRFSAVDWPFRIPVNCFEAVEGILNERLERQDDDEFAGEFERIADMTFNSFAQALFGLRKEGVFAADVFLTVCSTDPSHHMRGLEAQAVELLNSDALVREWGAR